MFIKFVDIDWVIFCVILTLVCYLRACHMWLTKNHMFIPQIWGKFTSFIFWTFEISLVLLGRFQNFKKVNSVNLSQISLLNMWLLVQISKKHFRRITLKLKNSPLCKASSKASIVWLTLLKIIEFIFIKVPSTLLLVETVESVNKLSSYALIHRDFRCFFFFFSNLTFTNQHFNPLRVG